MRLTVLVSILLLIYPGAGPRAQSRSGQLSCRVSDDSGPLEFAVLSLEELQLQTLTDSAGLASFTGIRPGQYKLTVSFLGFLQQSRQISIGAHQKLQIDFKLESLQLDEVVVTGTLREIKRSESPIPLQVISSKLFLKNPSPNLFESLSLINGLQPVLNCNVCNTGDIRINGMEGIYTQILIDGMPLVSGLGGVYGLMGIPNSMIERIEVVKGPAGSLYGAEAMAGQINVITRRPDRAPAFSAEYFSSLWAENQLDLGVRQSISKRLKMLMGIHGYWYDKPIDHNEDGFTDAALQKRISVFQKWHLQRPEDREASFAARFVYEDRWGGQLNWKPIHRGKDEVYGESIYTGRLELLSRYQFPTRTPVFFQSSYVLHKQDSYYGNVPYDALQQTGFLQAYADKAFGPHKFLGGLALRINQYDDNSPATIRPELSLLPGVFVQNEWGLKKHNQLLTGLRLDWHRHHGLVWSPRIAWHQHLGPFQSLRLSGGSGFRVVSLFTEDHAALSGAREVVIEETLRPERSWSGNLNYNLRINREKYFLEIDATAFWTQFSNRIIPDYDRDPQKIIYSNLDGRAISRGVSLQLDYSNGMPLKINAGISWMQVFQDLSDGSRIRQIRAPEWSGTLTASYTHPGSRIAIDLTGNWFGPQRLPVVPHDFRPEYSPWFAILNLQVSKKFSRKWELFAGVKNLLDFVPKDPILRPFDPFDRNADDPVSNPFGYRFDPSYNYGSMQGIRNYLGFRFKIGG